MKPENQVGENAKKKHTEKRPSNERVDTAFPGRAAPRTHSGGAWRGGSGRPGGRPVGRSPAPRPSGRERVSPRGPARPGTRRDRLEPRGAAGLPPGTGRPGRGGGAGVLTGDRAAPPREPTAPTASPIPARIAPLTTRPDPADTPRGGQRRPRNARGRGRLTTVGRAGAAAAMLGRVRVRVCAPGAPDV